jgi:hypothetical protein
MLSLLAAALLAAAPAPVPATPAKARPKPGITADTPVKLAAPQLSVLNMDARAGTFFNEHVAAALTAQGFRVTTAKEIEELVGLERRRQLVGCDESSACLSELANALGVDAIVSGEIGKFGGTYQILLKVNSAIDGRQLASYGARVNGEEAVLDEIAKGATAMAPQIAAAFGRTLHPVVQKQVATARDFAWMPALGGVLAAGAGGFFMYQASVRYQMLESPTRVMTLAEGDAVRKEGSLFQGAGMTAIGVGSAALIAAGGMFLFGGERPAATASAVVLPGGGVAVGVAGVLP